MKLTYVTHLPYRHLPQDFSQHYPESVISTPYRGLVDPVKMSADLRSSIDESMYAARAGYDAIGLTEHGQSSYDLNPNPDLVAATLAYALGTEELNTGLYVVGRSLGKSREPLRVAEELAWIDTLSGGRLLAGFPVGLPYDANINAGVPPIETRARYDENFKFVLRAWTEDEPFAWNGKFAQYPSVNVWPRPFQNPHPPISITGTGNPATTRFALERDLGFNLLILHGGPQSTQQIFDSMWQMADEMGVDDNPFRANLGVTVLVADTDAEAERLYSKHVEYSYGNGIGHIPMNRLALPGGIAPAGLRALLGHAMSSPPRSSEKPTYHQLNEAGVIVAGSVDSVRERLVDIARRYRVGNLLIFNQVGSMPTEVAKHNIDQFAAGVMPTLREVWSEYDATNRWWPVALGGQPASPAQAQSNGATLS